MLRRCTHRYHARCTAARACKYQQSCTRAQARAPRAGCCQSQGKLGRTHTCLGALRVSITGLQRPLVLLPRLATDTPSPVFSLSPSLVFLLPCPPSPGLPLRRTCSQRRSRMQWGALRARASRPPQQPPGLAGSRMLRPPRARLPVPRRPHRPHGGRLSQPEALQKGSTGAEKRQGSRVSPRPGKQDWGWGAGCSLQCSQPLCAHGGLDREGELKLGTQTLLVRILRPCGPLGELRSTAHRRTRAPGWPPTRS